MSNADNGGDEHGADSGDDMEAEVGPDELTPEEFDRYVAATAPSDDGVRGLRARKKLLAGTHIARTAAGLFLREGYANVSIAMVAEAAGVSKMTVTNYYRRKEDLLLDGPHLDLRDMARAVAARGPGESAADALRRVHVQGLDQPMTLTGLDPEMVPLMELISDDRLLLGGFRRRFEDEEAALARAVTTTRDGSGATAGAEGLPVRILAGQLVLIRRILVETNVGRLRRGGDPQEIRAAAVADAETAYATVGDL
jgi:AcrR family transcriptional regulator